MLCLNTEPPPPATKEPKPGGQEDRRTTEGHGEARTSNTLTAPPCECSIKYSTDMLEPNQGKNVQMQAQLIKVSDETDVQ